MSDATWQHIGNDVSLAEGESLALTVRGANGKDVDIFIARYRDRLVAYENTCRHLPVSLDYGDGRFFSPDGRYFVCQTHGARYHPATGRCVDGPCGGESLFAWQVEEREDGVWVRVSG